MLGSYAFVDRSVALRHTFSLFRSAVLGHWCDIMACSLSAD